MSNQIIKSMITKITKVDDSYYFLIPAKIFADSQFPFQEKDKLTIEILKNHLTIYKQSKNKISPLRGETKIQKLGGGFSSKIRKFGYYSYYFLIPAKIFADSQFPFQEKDKPIMELQKNKLILKKAIL